MSAPARVGLYHLANHLGLQQVAYGGAPKVAGSKEFIQALKNIFQVQGRGANSPREIRYLADQHLVPGDHVMAQRIFQGAGDAWKTPAGGNNLISRLNWHFGGGVLPPPPAATVTRSVQPRQGPLPPLSTPGAASAASTPAATPAATLTPPASKPLSIGTPPAASSAGPAASGPLSGGISGFGGPGPQISQALGATPSMSMATPPVNLTGGSAPPPLRNLGLGNRGPTPPPHVPPAPAAPAGSGVGRTVATGAGIVGGGVGLSALLSNLLKGNPSQSSSASAPTTTPPTGAASTPPPSSPQPPGGAAAPQDWTGQIGQFLKDHGPALGLGAGALGGLGLMSYLAKGDGAPDDEEED